jgi:hypothetical protein
MGLGSSTKPAILSRSSNHSIGSALFEDREFGNQDRFRRFARGHFNFGTNPLNACVRWYIDWNDRCAAVTPNHVQVERFEERLPDTSGWLGLDEVIQQGTLSRTVNAREGFVDVLTDGLVERVHLDKDFPRLCETAGRFGYEL